MGNLVGKIAPDYKCKAVVNGQIVNNFSLSNYKDKYIILFFYPLDFTFVCPTELHAFQDRLKDFAERDAQVIGCSVDSCYSHHAWLKTPRAMGGIEGIEYPIIADINKEFSQGYDVLVPDEGVSYRGLFLIDKNGKVRHQLINDLPIGRSVDEVLRTLDALIYFETHGEVCPANWRAGSLSMKPTFDGLHSYFAVTPK